MAGLPWLLGRNTAWLAWLVGIVACLWLFAAMVDQLRYSFTPVRWVITAMIATALAVGSIRMVEPMTRAFRRRNELAVQELVPEDRPGDDEVTRPHLAIALGGPATRLARWLHLLSSEWNRSKPAVLSEVRWLSLALAVLLLPIVIWGMDGRFWVRFWLVISGATLLAVRLGPRRAILAFIFLRPGWSRTRGYYWIFLMVVALYFAITAAALNGPLGPMLAPLLLDSGDVAGLILFILVLVAYTFAILNDNRAVRPREVATAWLEGATNFSIFVLVLSPLISLTLSSTIFIVSTGLYAATVGGFVLARRWSSITEIVTTTLVTLILANALVASLGAVPLSENAKEWSDARRESIDLALEASLLTRDFVYRDMHVSHDAIYLNCIGDCTRHLFDTNPDSSLSLNATRWNHALADWNADRGDLLGPLAHVRESRDSVLANLHNASEGTHAPTSWLVKMLKQSARDSTWLPEFLADSYELVPLVHKVVLNCSDVNRAELANQAWANIASIEDRRDELLSEDYGPLLRRVVGQSTDIEQISEYFIWNNLHALNFAETCQNITVELEYLANATVDGARDYHIKVEAPEGYRVHMLEIAPLNQGGWEFRDRGIIRDWPMAARPDWRFTLLPHASHPGFPGAFVVTVSVIDENPNRPHDWTGYLSPRFNVPLIITEQQITEGSAPFFR